MSEYERVFNDGGRYVHYECVYMSVFVMAVDLMYSLETITLSAFINTHLSKDLRRAIRLVWIRKWSWHHHQPATAVLKTRRLNIYCRDAHFCRQQEETCGQRRSSYTPNSTAARRNWRRQLHSTCRLGSQCSGDWEEGWNKLTVWKFGNLKWNSSRFHWSWFHVE